MKTAKKRQTSQRKMRDVFGIMFSMTKKSGAKRVHMLYPGDFTPYEIAAIGAITVQWAYLEHMVLISTIELADIAGIEMPFEATATSFDLRVKSWKDVIELATSGAEQKRLIGLATKIASLQHDRHRIIHGLWEWYEAEPTKLRSYSFLRPQHAQDHRYTLKRLAQIANDIGQLNYELAYPPRKGLKKIELPHSYMSRHAMLAFSGANLVELGLLPPKPPKLSLREAAQRVAAERTPNS